MYLPTFVQGWRSPFIARERPQSTQQQHRCFAEDRFYRRCDHLVQNLLLRCTWRITWRADVPVLTITCANTFLYGQILHEIYDIGRALHPLGHNARIRLYRPLGWIFPFEMKLEDLFPRAIAHPNATVEDIPCQSLAR
jgi:hypothetical protein